ncbi:MAG: hypothetical protein A3J28_14640 [Acidobacteria bacterium RIFCSPLOWO2_12_FULL_60_22]|nr:MAG: hypothetical protein A3J28_14640 [Acidobacteria bacterium RIFCSPLOWO2_12_FULL_60_22]
MKKNPRISLRFAGTLLWAAVLVRGIPCFGAQSPLALEVRHDHGWGSCSGTLTLDDTGVKYETAHKEDARSWVYEDIQQFQVEESRRLKVYTYEDRKWRLGADKVFQFDWADGAATPKEVYEFLQARTHRPVAAWLRPSEIGQVLYEFPVKHLGGLSGRPGKLLFTDRAVVLQSDQKQGNRTWRYEDLESVSSAGLYDLTLTTYEQQKFHYASRRVYNFQLKESLPSADYDALWRFVNEKKGLDVLPTGSPRGRVR